MNSSSNKSVNWQNAAIDLTRKSKGLEVATGALGLEMLQDGADREHRRLKSEEEATHLKRWGEPMPEEEDEMRQTILGDNNVHYHRYPEEKPPARDSLNWRRWPWGRFFREPGLPGMSSPICFNSHQLSSR